MGEVGSILGELYNLYSRVGRGHLVLRHFRSSLSADFWRNCVLSSETQRRALICYQGEEMKILNSFLRLRIEPTIVMSLCHMIVALQRDGRVEYI